MDRVSHVTGLAAALLEGVRERAGRASIDNAGCRSMRGTIVAGSSDQNGDGSDTLHDLSSKSPSIDAGSFCIAPAGDISVYETQP
ncbi:MAG: hypothetical protein P8R54_14060 [Myxococcota bacterium]|nr:hypothetical protein [Myxococcota bacterium]